METAANIGGTLGTEPAVAKASSVSIGRRVATLTGHVAWYMADMNLAALLTFALSAHAGEPPPRGATIYASSCAACHGGKGNGKGPASIAMKPKPTDFTAAAWWEGRTDDAIAASIRAGRPGTAMSAFPKLTDEELAAVVSYLHTFEQKP